MDPAVQQALQQMQAQHQQEMAAMQHAIQAAIHSAASPHPPMQPHAAAVGPPRVDRPKLPSPPSYDGKAAALDEWVSDLDQQFDWYQMSAEADRLRFATAYLKSAARDWWTHLGAADKAQVASWSALVDALRRRFQPVITADLARARLAVLAQGKASVHEYVSAFRKLMVSLADMGEADRLFAFARGVKPVIATQLRVHGVKTVEAAIEMAVRIGSMGEFAVLAGASSSVASSSASVPMELDALLGIEGLERETDLGSEGGASSSAAAAADAPVTRAEFAQLLAAMQAQRAPRPFAQKGAPAAAAPSSSPMHRDDSGRLQFGSLTQSQMDAHWTAGTCFQCGKAGHRARKCPKKQSN